MVEVSICSWPWGSKLMLHSSCCKGFHIVHLQQNSCWNLIPAETVVGSGGTFKWEDTLSCEGLNRDEAPPVGWVWAEKQIWHFLQSLSVHPPSTLPTSPSCFSSEVSQHNRSQACIEATLYRHQLKQTSFFYKLTSLRCFVIKTENGLRLMSTRWIPFEK